MNPAKGLPTTIHAYSALVAYAARAGDSEAGALAHVLLAGAVDQLVATRVESARTSQTAEAEDFTAGQALVIQQARSLLERAPDILSHPDVDVDEWADSVRAFLDGLTLPPPSSEVG